MFYFLKIFFVELENTLFSYRTDIFKNFWTTAKWKLFLNVKLICIFPKYAIFKFDQEKMSLVGSMNFFPRADVLINFVNICASLLE